jgi:hypothetical protein
MTQIWHHHLIVLGDYGDKINVVKAFIESPIFIQDLACMQE